MSSFIDELRRAFGQHVPGPTRHYSDFSEEEKAKYRASAPVDAQIETTRNLLQFPEVTFGPELNEGERMARMRAIPIEYDESVVGSNGEKKTVVKTGYVAVDEDDLAKNKYLQGLARGRREDDTGRIGVYSLVLDDGFGGDGDHSYKSVSGQEAMDAIDALRKKNLRVATQMAPYKDKGSEADWRLYYDRSYPYLYESNDPYRYSYRYGNSNGNWNLIPGAVDEFINRYRSSR